jgi:hypothetical protein
MVHDGKIWFATPVTEEQKTLPEWRGWQEHPGGYVVEVYLPTGYCQWDTGFKTLEEAVAFAKSKGSSNPYASEYLPKSWAGRPDGDEGKW